MGLEKDPNLLDIKKEEGKRRRTSKACDYCRIKKVDWSFLIDRLNATMDSPVPIVDRIELNVPIIRKRRKEMDERINYMSNSWRNE